MSKAERNKVLRGYKLIRGAGKSQYLSSGFIVGIFLSFFYGHLLRMGLEEY